MTGGDTLVYTWDDQNRLVAVAKEGEDPFVTYEYDDDNIRVSQTVEGETTEFVVDKNRAYAQVLAEYIGSQLIEEYVYGLDLIEQTDGTTGDDGSGVVDTYAYDAYGNLLPGSTAVAQNDYLYQGEQYDDFAEMQYLRARYYDPDLGRFPTVDPYAGRLKSPMTLHRYMYANNNPIKFNDPSGESSVLAMNSILQQIGMRYNAAYAAAAPGIIGGVQSGVSGALAAEFLTTGAIIGAAAATAAATLWWRKDNGTQWTGPFKVGGLRKGGQDPIDSQTIEQAIDQLPFELAAPLKLISKVNSAFSGTGNLKGSGGVANFSAWGITAGTTKLEIIDNPDTSTTGTTFTSKYDMTLYTVENFYNPGAFTGLFLAGNIKGMVPSLPSIRQWDSVNTGLVAMGGGLSGLGAVGTIKNSANYLEAFEVLDQKGGTVGLGSNVWVGVSVGTGYF